MAERPEDLDVETPDPMPSGAAGVGAAMAAALGRRIRGVKADPKLDAFLDEQTRLARLQTEHLHEQRTLVLSNLKLRRVNEWIKALLQSMTAIVGLAVVIALAVMAWQAHEDHALVIEPFSIPSAYAQQGLTGPALASELMDKLSAIVRVARQNSLGVGVSGVQADSADEVKMEIPETGVSIGEVQRLLRSWLGHERRVEGELRQTSDGQLLLITRMEGRAFTASGPAASLDQLEQQAAEQVFAAADPVNEVIFLGQTNRQAQAADAAQKLARNSPIYIALWAEAEAALDPLRSAKLARLAVSMTPGSPFGDDAQIGVEPLLGHDEATYSAARRLLADLSSGPANEMSGHGVHQQGVNHLRALAQYEISVLQGAFASVSVSSGSREQSLLTRASDAARGHDQFRATNLLDQAVASGEAEEAALAHIRGVLDAEAGDWAAAASEFRTAMDRDRTAHASDPFPEGIAAFAEVSAVGNGPPLAEALAQMRDYSGAEAAIAPTPLDCYPCLRERGRVAAMQGHWPEADRWFAEAERQGPSLPFADTDWGEMLLRKGDPTGAIAKLEQAHKLGPHYADPLEVWGEALMAKRDYAGAISKFTEADRDAPKWGRNHLRWGEALMLSGKYAEARTQYETAKGLDLSVGDRAALNVLLARTARGPLHG